MLRRNLWLLSTVGVLGLMLVGRAVAVQTERTAKENRAMRGFSTNIEQRTLENRDFRRVLYTGPHSQLVVMTLKPGEEIGMERHRNGDQFIRVESGHGEAIIGGTRHPLSDGIAVVVPAGSEHNVINTSQDQPLRLYTVYAPPQHAEGTIHRTKQDALKEEHPEPHR